MSENKQITEEELKEVKKRATEKVITLIKDQLTNPSEDWTGPDVVKYAMHAVDAAINARELVMRKALGRGLVPLRYYAKIPLGGSVEAYRRLKAMSGLEEKVLNVLPNPPCNQEKGAKEAADLLKRCVAAAVADSVEVAEERVLFKGVTGLYEKWLPALNHAGRPVRTDGTSPDEEPRLVISVVAPCAWKAISGKLHDILGQQDLYWYYHRFGFDLWGDYILPGSEPGPDITSPGWFLPDNTGCHSDGLRGCFFWRIDKLLQEKGKTGK